MGVRYDGFLVMMGLYRRSPHRGWNSQIAEKASYWGLQADPKRGILVGSYIEAWLRAAPTGPGVFDRILKLLPTR